MSGLAVRRWWRSPVARALDAAPFGALLRLLERIDRGRTDVLAVLTYHRVAPLADLAGFPGLVSATPGRFAEQMEHLVRHHRVIGMDDLLAARAGRALPRRPVLVTFDDAYRDFAEHAWPVLRRLRLPATLFVPTAFADEPERSFWWDRIYTGVAAAPSGTVLEIPSIPRRTALSGEPGRDFRQLRADLKSLPHPELLAAADAIDAQLGRPPLPGQVLGWDELRSLAADGVTLAPHTRTHPLLPQIEATELEAEIAGSYADLVQRIGSVPRALAYPSGAHSPEVREAVRAAGYEVAFTTLRGLNRLGRTDWLELRRINVGGATTLNALRAQLGRWALAWSA